MNKLYGKPGLANIITLNGQSITVPGSHGEPPVILRNGEHCSLDDAIESGDQLFVTKGADGQKAEIQLKELIDEIPSKDIKINGVHYTISASLNRNGKIAAPEDYIHDNDEIEVKIPETVEDMLRALGLHELLAEIRPFRVKINGKETFISAFSGILYRNGKEIKPFSSYEHCDEIIIEKKELLTLRELAHLKQIMLSQNIPVSFNGKEIHLSKPVTVITRDGQPLSESDEIYDGDSLLTEQKKIEPFIFQDLFSHVDIEVPSQTNGRFILLKNGEQTTFDCKLDPGDDLKIVWPLEKNTKLAFKN